MRGHFPRPSDVLVGHARKNRLGDTPGRPLILKKFGRYSQRPIGGQTAQSGQHAKFGQDQIGALGPVLNAIVLWTTTCIDAAVTQLRAESHELRDEDIARLSRLKHRDLNLLGRYNSTASTPAAGALRPLPDPDALELDEDESE